MDTASLPPLLQHSQGLNQLAFRSDGMRLAVADTALNVEVRDGDGVVWTRSLANDDVKVAPVQRIRGLAYAPDGMTLYALGTDTLFALDAESGAVRWSYQPSRTLGFLVVTGASLAVREDGLVAAAFDNGAIGVWTVWGELKGLWKDVDTQRRMVFLHDGRLLGDDSFGLSVFDVETRKRLYRTPLRDRSFGLAIAPDGCVAVRTLHEAWQIAPRGEVFARTPVDPGLPLLAYHPYRRLLALGAAHSVDMVDPNGEIVERFDIPSTTVVSMTFARNGQLWIGGADRTLSVINAEERPTSGRRLRV